MNQGKKDPADIGCLAACIASLCGVVGSIISTLSVYIGSLSLALIGISSTTGWHTMMSFILVSGIITIVYSYKCCYPRELLYRYVAICGFSLGYISIWLLFTFMEVR